VAAAASYVEVAVDAAPALLVLEHGVRSRDRLARGVAAHALARLDPRNAALERLLAPRRRPSRRRRSRTSTIVHGTWARTSAWWQPPGGDFWKFLHDNVDPQLYGAGDRFEWSGGYSDAARALGGNDLRDWVLQHDLDGLDLFTHSHGGSVAMLATQAGVRVGRLVLLSCPVHWPKYTPDFTRVTRAVSVRVHLDLVILVDGGGQRFPDSRIEEHVLPIWFDHFATHDPDTWLQYQVASVL
jgi:predicted alpha/beta-hydrolase family hydrolase